jgi:hypothetical protein
LEKMSVSTAGASFVEQYEIKDGRCI